VDSGEKRLIVEQQLADARALGIDRTPSFIIGGQLIPGVLPLEDFRSLIEGVAAESS
jgi:protein-disulfide isomerase